MTVDTPGMDAGRLRWYHLQPRRFTCVVPRNVEPAAREPVARPNAGPAARHPPG